MKKLQPCPFCGGRVNLIKGKPRCVAYPCNDPFCDEGVNLIKVPTDEWYPKCSGCGAEMPLSETKKEAIDNWNRRVKNDSKGIS